VLPHYSGQDWNPFAARNWFMGDPQWDGKKRGSTQTGFRIPDP